MDTIDPELRAQTGERLVAKSKEDGVMESHSFDLPKIKKDKMKLNSLCPLKSGWQDSNLRPPAPKAGAIPGYATPRTGIFFFNSLFRRGCKASF
jgi:hypothetical protein